MSVKIQNKPATVTSSSAKPDHPAFLAFDGDRATFWQSDPRSHQSKLSAEFADDQLIKDLIIVKRRGFPNRYQNLCVRLGVSFILK